MTFSTEEVRQAFDKYDEGHKGQIMQFFGYAENVADYNNRMIDGLGLVEFVDDCHIEGQMYQIVFKIGKQYFAHEYQFSSWNDIYYNNYVVEVKPVETTITVYDRI